MSDCGLSAYGDEASVAESVASQFDEENDREERQKFLNKNNDTTDDPDEKYQSLNSKLSNQDRIDIYNTFKNVIFQDVSNDKLFILKIKKI